MAITEPSGGANVEDPTQHGHSMVRNSGIYGRAGDPFLLSKCSAAKEYACDVSIWVANKTMELMAPLDIVLTVMLRNTFEM